MRFKGCSFFQKTAFKKPQISIEYGGEASIIVD